MYDLFMDHFNLNDPGEIISWAYSGKQWSDIAALGLLVYQAADNGDVTANKIIEETSENIYKLIELTMNKMNNCNTVVLSGGNLTHENSKLRIKVEEKLKHEYPNIEIVQPTLDPAEASALLAKNYYLD